MLRTHLSTATALTLLGIGACNASHTAAPAPSPTAPTAPFAPDPPSVYVAKVKNVLVGLPPTDDELKAVAADPTKLRALIDGWMATPEYTSKMTTFFELAFQQTQISIQDLADQVFPRSADPNGTTAPLLTQNVKESFARTVLALNAEGRPLTEAMTTERFMMTPALMELYAFLDTWQVDDAGKVVDGFKKANPGVELVVSASSGPIPIEDSVNPQSPSYMHWYNPDITAASGQDPSCVADPIVYPPSAISLHFLLYGAQDNRKSPTGAPCLQRGGSAAAPQLTATDFSSWKMVTIRKPNAGETPTAFYDLPTLRGTSELVLTIPRVGFFTTPAFFANWQTNTSNQMRVTMNQALIVATGAAVDGTDATLPPSTPGLDAAHAADPACNACHQTLDPTRSLLASTYSWNYHHQTESSFAQQPGLFAFQGVVKPVASVADLGATLAQHPLVPQAWAQKLCYYANSSACDVTDPEFKRVVSVFQSSGYLWNALVKELLSSPVTTNAAPTKTTAATGPVVAIARRDHLCAALDHRLGLTDACGLDALTKAQAKTVIPEIVSGLPSDGYGRGSVAPVLPNRPTPFFRTGTENICEAVAAETVDPTAPRPGVKRWSGAAPEAAVADFVALVMGLPPSDPRATPAQALLLAHFNAAKSQGGVTATDALRSTFVAACLSPSAVSIGL